MELNQLSAFVAVAEELHFGRAAEKCNLAAPALSRLIKSLEDELGVTLLTRTTRQVTLTRSGLKMLEEAKALLVKAEAAISSVREEHHNVRKLLRIGAIDAASASFLSDIVSEFRRNDPAIEIHFVEAMTKPLMTMLEAGKLDICLVRPPRMMTDCAFEVLRVELPFVMLPDGHPLLAKSRINMADLAVEPIIVPARRSRPYAYDLVMAHFESVGAVPKISIEATEKPAVMAAVAAGLGIAIVPDWVTRLTFPGVHMRKLYDAPLDPPHPGALLGVAWRKEQRLSVRDAFLSLLRERVALFSDDDVGLKPRQVASNITPLKRRHSA
jgi:DNA-binding transcriptional LysR family regulator